MKSWVCVVTAAAVLLGSLALSAQPRFAESSGHAFGERITLAHQAERWLSELASASDRVSFSVQGRSWEGRPLMLAVITSPENHARIADIQWVAQRMDDPRLGAVSDAEREQQPVIIWFGGSIHGFELSGSEGLLRLVEHLAFGEDEETQRLLRDAVVLVDPMLNPDGRDAFAHRNHQALGGAPNPNPQDWANDFVAWEALQFRTGHYFFRYQPRLVCAHAARNP
jgi:murein tripeptide amidase MpaA